MIPSKQLAFIGAGHLVGSLVRGLVRQGYSPQSMVVSNPSRLKLDQLASDVGVCVTTSNQEAATGADVVIVGVKPGLMKTVCQDLACVVNVSKPLIISLATAICVDDIATWLATDSLGIARVMTNIALGVGMGSTALFANARITPQQRALTEALFKAVGHAFWVDAEADLNTLTPLIGSGPAYVYLFMEALQQAAVQQGIPALLAEQAMLAMVSGAIELAKQSKVPVHILRQQVTTPNGVTAAALQVFLEEDLYFKSVNQSFKDAISRCEAIPSD